MNQYDIVVAGAGIGGICAAVGAAREGCSVLLVEKDDEIGGTGIHSPVGLICKFRDHDGNPINMGLHKELFPQAYGNPFTPDGKERVPVYDEKELLARYHAVLKAEANITVWTGSEVEEVFVSSGRIEGLRLKGSHSGEVSAKVFIDGTGDGNLACLAGAKFEKGRSLDGKTQAATLTFKVTDFDRQKLIIPDITTWEGIRSLRKELTSYYLEIKQAGGTNNLRSSVLCFPYPGGEAILFNSTSFVGVDPTNEETMEWGMEEGKKQVKALFQAIRKHPAFTGAKIEFVSRKLGVREGRRITGDYVLTMEDCMGLARFEDMVAACSYDLDIHSPATGVNEISYHLPYPGYYHIPYRCLIAKDLENLLLGSRCISGSFEAHSSYRVMSGISAIGQAAGTAAALTVKQGVENVRRVKAENIRYVLQKREQFVEGTVEPV